MSDQTVIPGFRRFLPPPEYERQGWKDAAGNPVPVKRQPATFYGATVPVPHDRRGVELRCGPLRVLQRTDGRYVVYDERRPFGENDAYLGGRKRAGLREAVLWMVRYAREEGIPVPETPARRSRA